MLWLIEAGCELRRAPLSEGYELRNTNIGPGYAWPGRDWAERVDESPNNVSSALKGAIGELLCQRKTKR